MKSGRKILHFVQDDRFRPSDAHIVSLSEAKNLGKKVNKYKDKHYGKNHWY